MRTSLLAAVHVFERAVSQRELLLACVSMPAEILLRASPRVEFYDFEAGGAFQPFRVRFIERGRIVITFRGKLVFFSVTFAPCPAPLSASIIRTSIVAGDHNFGDS